MIQQSGLYAVATGTANAHVAAFSPPITTRTDGMVLRYKAPAANTGALTFNDGLGAVAVVGAAHAALQGGETAVNGDVWLQWNSSIGGGSYVLIDSTGGAVQVAPATQSQHAPQMGQVAGVVGSTRNLAMSVTAASATATLTADEIIVETALGGVRYCLPSFSKTINLATTGAGGMDTGTAAANGFLGLYAIYNPTTQTAALLGKMESGAALPSVYGGANMPSGYTASGLVAVVPISATAGQFASFSVVDRLCSIIENTVISSSTTSTTGGNTPITASGVPYSARKISGSISLTNTISANSIWQFFADANSTGKVQYSINTAASGGNLFGYANMPLSAPRTLRATTFTSTGSNSLAYILLSSSYEI
jgi:hypothetical protein